MIFYFKNRICKQVYYKCGHKYSERCDKQSHLQLAFQHFMPCIRKAYDIHYISGSGHIVYYKITRMSNIQKKMVCIPAVVEDNCPYTEAGGNNCGCEH